MFSKSSILENFRDASAPPLRIHLIGVAGSGMSGLASLLMALGHRVSGSDRVTTEETERMARNGMLYLRPHSAEATDDVEAVIYSTAIRPDNLTYAAAVARGIPLVRRAEALAAVMQRKSGVVVAGTHGKTTTSSMAAHVLRGADLKPSHYVGAEIPILGSNAHWSPWGEHFVAEGDESDGTLINFHPDYTILLNIEEEHLDHYKDIHEIKDVFRTLTAQTAKQVVYCGEDSNCRDLLGHSPKAVSYGWGGSNDYCAHKLEEQGMRTQFEVLKRGEVLGSFVLNIPGKHNVLNALAVVALATEVGVDPGSVADALRTFRGAKRRFDIKHESYDHTVVDDYGHHPTEIAATLTTARSLNRDRLVVVFQPHRYTRTQKFCEEFGKAFKDADAVFVTEIYPASEEPIPGVTGQLIVDEIKKNGVKNVFYSPEFERAHLEVGNYLRNGDLLITLGAGHVHEIGTQVAKDLSVLEKLVEIMGETGERCRLYEPMNRHTTIRIGGPAQYWLEPHTIQGFANAVKYCRRNDIPIRVVGRGSNLLVKDGGIAGVVIHPAKGEFSDVHVDGEFLEAGVGARFKKLTSVAQKAGVGGFEWMEGIPGNVGGGLRMNAGAMGIQTFDQVVKVRILTAEGKLVEKSVEEFDAEYRNVPELTENYAVSAVFKGVLDSPEAIAAKVDASKGKRKNSQPIAASAGCIFKNPESCPAGKLVDDLGLKNAQVGKARVSEVHGNFIVNDGKASAADVLGLIDKIKAKALEEHGIMLETEVQILGEDVHPI